MKRKGKREKLEKVRATLVASVPSDRMAYARSVWSRREIHSLTTQILGLRRDTNRHLVDVGLDVGRLLLQARPQLEGLFQLWVKDVLHIDPKTASNLLTLVEASTVEPDFVEEWKDLGLTKLYALARLPPEARAKVLRTAHLDEKNDREFAKLLKPHRPARRVPVTPRMQAHGARIRLRAWRTKAKAMAVPKLTGPERELLRAEYQSLIAVLEDHLSRLG